MDCPYCGTYNPEGRTTCWRCDKELPKRKPPKRRDPQKSAKMWLYVGLAIFFAITVLQMCGFRLPFGPQAVPPQGPGGYLPEPLPFASIVLRFLYL